MPFPKRLQRTATNVGNVLVLLEDPGAGHTARFEVEIRYSDGTVETVKGDLLPHLTPAQTAQLRAFMATMRAKAVAELL